MYCSEGARRHHDAVRVRRALRLLLRLLRTGKSSYFSRNPRGLTLCVFRSSGKAVTSHVDCGSSGERGALAPDADKTAKIVVALLFAGSVFKLGLHLKKMLNQFSMNLCVAKKRASDFRTSSGRWSWVSVSPIVVPKRGLRMAALLFTAGDLDAEAQEGDVCGGGVGDGREGVGADHEGGLRRHRALHVHHRYTHAHTRTHTRTRTHTTRHTTRTRAYTHHKPHTYDTHTHVLSRARTSYAHASQTRYFETNTDTHTQRVTSTHAHFETTL